MWPPEIDGDGIGESAWGEGRLNGGKASNHVYELCKVEWTRVVSSKESGEGCEGKSNDAKNLSYKLVVANETHNIFIIVD